MLAIGLWLSGCAQMPKETGTVFYPMPPETPRIQFLTSISTETDIGVKRNTFQEYLIGKEIPTNEIGRPWDIDHEPGKLYVVDKEYGKVIILNIENPDFDYIKDEKGGAIAKPAGMFITSDGYKYIADSERGQILVYNTRNEFDRAYGEENQFKPLDVAVLGNRIYVCDLKDQEIEVLDKETGRVIQKIGKHGQAEGTFHWPTHVSLDNKGNIYVTDFLNSRVQKFDKDGKFVRVIGGIGDHPGGMPRPKGIALDHEGHLYVVDVAFEMVQVFDTDTGDVLLPFGKMGATLRGGSYLPAGIHIDYDNLKYFSKYVDPDFKAKYLIYVGNQAGPHKINVYAFGEWIGPKLMAPKSTPAKAVE